MFKPFQSILIFLLLAPASTFAEDLEALLARNARAHGGPEAWAQIENVRYELTISEPGFTVLGTYVATRRGEMRIDIVSDGKKVFSEGLLDGRAWQWSPDGGVTPQDEKSTAALRHGIEMPGRFFTLQDLAENGVNVDLVGEVQENGKRQWQVRVTLDDGFSRDYYIDDESGLMVRERDRRALHPAVSATEVTVETSKEEAAWLNGVLYYKIARIINADSGEWLATTRIRSLEHNIEIPGGYFLQE